MQINACSGTVTLSGDNEAPIDSASKDPSLAPTEMQRF